MHIRDKSARTIIDDSEDTAKVSNRDASNSDSFKMSKEQKAQYLEKMNRRIEAAQKKQLRKLRGIDRDVRTRVLIHAGGILEATGLLRYRFKDKSDYDNPQDDLQANLLCGSFLMLADLLSTATEAEIRKLIADGKEFRFQKVSEREIPEVSPYINSDI